MILNKTKVIPKNINNHSTFRSKSSYNNQNKFHSFQIAKKKLIMYGNIVFEVKWR